jgi:hypothetical protein
MTEPRTFTDAELHRAAQSLALAILTGFTAKQMSAADIASMTALACAEVQIQCHGPAGIEHMRNAADVCEAQLLGRES